MSEASPSLIKCVTTFAWTIRAEGVRDDTAREAPIGRESQ